MEQIYPKLRRSSEYRRLYQPMSKHEYTTLEQEITEQKNTVIIKAWSNILLYEYEKYEICRKHCIPYKVSVINARNSEEALLWLCKKQLERADLTPEMRRYLIGKRYLYERILGAYSASNRWRGLTVKNSARYDGRAAKIQERLGNEYKLSPITILKYSVFAEAIDIIYEISEELSNEILNGIIKISQENTAAISKMPKNEIINIAENILHGKEDIAALTNSLKTAQAAALKSNKRLLTGNTSIKDMPEYDPDAEVSSLTLTIPSWISSLLRVCNVCDMNKVSAYAKNKLLNELEKLGNAIFEMLDVLKED